MNTHLLHEYVINYKLVILYMKDAFMTVLHNLNSA